MSSPTGLRRFVGEQPASPEPPPAGLPAAELPASERVERCDLCAVEVSAQHGHVADLETSSLLCACRPCYLLFTRQVVGAGRYKAVPDRYLADPGRVMSPAEFDQLEIPVGLAFFLRSSRDSKLSCFYPSPAGVTECQLDLQRWQSLVEAYPLLGQPADDVEAVVISGNHSRGADDGVEYYIVPVDACYELAGRMRLQWRGFDGGSEARASLAAFLAEVRKRAGGGG